MPGKSAKPLFSHLKWSGHARRYRSEKRQQEIPPTAVSLHQMFFSFRKRKQRQIFKVFLLLHHSLVSCHAGMSISCRYLYTENKSSFVTVRVLHAPIYDQVNSICTPLYKMKDALIGHPSRLSQIKHGIFECKETSAGKAPDTGLHQAHPPR